MTDPRIAVSRTGPRSLIVRAGLTGLMFAPIHNRNRREGETHDPTDANWFIQGAERLSQLYGASWWQPPLSAAARAAGRRAIRGLVYVDNSAHKRAATDMARREAQIPMLEEMKRVLEAYRGPRFNVVAFFCHGHTTYIQLGLNVPATPPPLARSMQRREALSREFIALLATKCTRDVVVPLYACSTGGRTGDSGVGSFAHHLCTELGRTLPDVRVDGHTRPGDGLCCPCIRRFEGSSATPYWLVPYEHERWPTWNHRVSDGDLQGDELKFNYPFLGTGALHFELRRGPERTRRANPC
jgi:hypothetical protein